MYLEKNLKYQSSNLIDPLVVQDISLFVLLCVHTIPDYVCGAQ